MAPMLTCPVCDADALYVLGTLGSTTHYRCRACGANGASVDDHAATEPEPDHCYGGGTWDPSTPEGGCHAGEPIEVAFCECECVKCNAVRAL